MKAADTHPVRLRTLEDEHTFLRACVAALDARVGPFQTIAERNRLALRVLREYADTPAHDILHETVAMPAFEVSRTAHSLARLHPDDQLDEILRMLGNVGIRNMLAVAARLHESTEREFLEICIGGLYEGFSVPSWFSEPWRAAPLALFEVQSPIETGQVAENREAMVSALSRLLGDASPGTTLSLEAANPYGAKGSKFFIAAPHEYARGIVQLLAMYRPGASCIEHRGGYALAPQTYHFQGGYLQPQRLFVGEDVGRRLTRLLAQLSKYGEGMSIQAILSAVPDAKPAVTLRALAGARESNRARELVRNVGEILQDTFVLTHSPERNAAAFVDDWQYRRPLSRGNETPFHTGALALLWQI